MGRRRLRKEVGNAATGSPSRPDPMPWDGGIHWGRAAGTAAFPWDARPRSASRAPDSTGLSVGRPHPDSRCIPTFPAVGNAEADSRAAAAESVGHTPKSGMQAARECRAAIGTCSQPREERERRRGQTPPWNAEAPRARFPVFPLPPALFRLGEKRGRAGAGRVARRERDGMWGWGGSREPLPWPRPLSKGRIFRDVSGIFPGSSPPASPGCFGMRGKGRRGRCQEGGVPEAWSILPYGDGGSSPAPWKPGSSFPGPWETGSGALGCRESPRQPTGIRLRRAKGCQGAKPAFPKGAVALPRICWPAGAASSGIPEGHVQGRASEPAVLLAFHGDGDGDGAWGCTRNSIASFPASVWE